jgi:hypothetical protein
MMVALGGCGGTRCGLEEHEMKHDVAIIGAGGFAREVLDVFDAVNANGCSFSVLGFIVDAEYGGPGTEVNGKPVLGGFDWVAKHSTSVQLICGVGAPQHRMRLIRRAETSGGRWSIVGAGSTVIRMRAQHDASAPATAIKERPRDGT